MHFTARKLCALIPWRSEGKRIQVSRESAELAPLQGLGPTALSSKKTRGMALMKSGRGLSGELRGRMKTAREKERPLTVSVKRC